jgi:hypothetical protein
MEQVSCIIVTADIIGDFQSLFTYFLNRYFVAHWRAVVLWLFCGHGFYYSLIILYLGDFWDKEIRRWHLGLNFATPNMQETIL